MLMEPIDASEYAERGACWSAGIAAVGLMGPAGSMDMGCCLGCAPSCGFVRRGVLVCGVLAQLAVLHLCC
jgi:hypothetical protein